MAVRERWPFALAILLMVAGAAPLLWKRQAPVPPRAEGAISRFDASILAGEWQSQGADCLENFAASVTSPERLRIVTTTWGCLDEDTSPFHKTFDLAIHDEPGSTLSARLTGEMRRVVDESSWGCAVETVRAQVTGEIRDGSAINLHIEEMRYSAVSCRAERTGALYNMDLRPRE